MVNNTGGPAFPTKRRIQRAGYLTDEYEPCGGMTLRDYFAAKAMQGIVSHDPTFAKEYVEMAAKDAYAYADAMLKAREQ